MLYAEAKKKTDAWLSLVQQGRVQEAFQLSQSSTDRFQGPGSLASHYAEAPPTKSRSHSTDEMEGLAGMQPSPAEQLKEFVSSPLVAKLLEFDEQARFEHLRNVGMRSEAGNLKITQRYRVSGVCSGQPDSMDFLVVASRYESRKLASWSVGDIRPVE